MSVCGKVDLGRPRQSLVHPGTAADSQLKSGTARFSQVQLGTGVWCLGKHLWDVRGIIWGMSGACLGHHLGYHLGHVWSLIWGMSGASSGECPGHDWVIISNGQHFAVLLASVSPLFIFSSNRLNKLCNCHSYVSVCCQFSPPWQSTCIVTLSPTQFAYLEFLYLSNNRLYLSGILINPKHTVV